MGKDATVVGSRSEINLVACLERASCAGPDREFGVATLGPRGTSSEVAAHHVLKLYGEGGDGGGRVRLYPSFEEAGEAVMEGSETALVVANAYSKINALYMNPALFLAGAFILPTPDYGVAAPLNAPLPLKVKIATHPAPAALVGELVRPSFFVGETVAAPSTSEAARMVVRGQGDLALTNETSAREHRLRFVSPTRRIRISGRCSCPAGASAGGLLEGIFRMVAPGRRRAPSRPLECAIRCLRNRSSTHLEYLLHGD